MWRPPTLDEIRVALFSETLKAVSGNERVFVAPASQDADPELKKLILFCSFTPGKTVREELGGYGALGERPGIWRMTISALPDNDADEAWKLADTLEKAFLPYTVDGLSVTDDEVMPVYCNFPYTEDRGILPDNRLGILVTVPWWARIQN